MGLSNKTIILGFFIVISASFMRQILDFFYASIGKENAVFMLGVSFIIIFIVFLWQISISKANIYRKLLFVIVLALGLYWSWSLRIVAERIHILEYGLLGCWTAGDLLKNKINIRAGAIIIMILFTFAFLDEGFQYFLPYRVYDLRDIVFNLSGGLWGLALFLIKRQPQT